MFLTLSAGDQVQIGESVTLTVLAVEGNLVSFGLEAPGPGLPEPGPPDPDSPEAGPGFPRRQWEWN